MPAGDAPAPRIAGTRPAGPDQAPGAKVVLVRDGKIPIPGPALRPLAAVLLAAEAPVELDRGAGFTNVDCPAGEWTVTVWDDGRRSSG